MIFHFPIIDLLFLKSDPSSHYVADFTRQKALACYSPNMYYSQGRRSMDRMVMKEESYDGSREDRL